MTTPIEVAALAVDNLPWDGQRGGVDPGNVEIARAVFQSIDREGLARMLYRRDIPDDTDFWDNGLPDNFKRLWLLKADAINAYLTGDQS